MNARLQVEHPVTEAVTGEDLVEWQIRVAAGESLPRAQEMIRLSGHAIEARFCAEDPANGFMPAPGLLRKIGLPSQGAGVRIDTGVESGDSVPPEYDSMIAKVIVRGRNRPEALGRLAEALSGIRISGPPTNLEFLLALVESPEFRSGSPDTGFVERMLQANGLASPPPPLEAIVAVSLSVHLAETERWTRRRGERLGANSPFSSVDGWRIQGAAEQIQALQWGNEEHEVRLRPLNSGAWAASVDQDAETRFARPSDAGLIRIATGDQSHWVPILTEAEEAGSAWWAFQGTRRWRFDVPVASERSESGGDTQNAFRAPLPGHILRHHVQAGDLVEAGDPLVTVEAMKTEHTIRSPGAGRIVALHGEIGGSVNEGEKTARFRGADSHASRGHRRSAAGRRGRWGGTRWAVRRSALPQRLRGARSVFCRLACCLSYRRTWRSSRPRESTRCRKRPASQHHRTVGASSPARSASCSDWARWFVGLGATASAFGAWLAEHRFVLGQISGAAIILFGLHFLGVLRIGFLNRDTRFMVGRTAGGPAGAYVMGLAFAFGWTPCIGPILASILFVAAQQDTIGEATLLLSVYAAGLGVPFLIAATFIQPFQRFLQRARPHLRLIEAAMGVFLIGVGIAFLAGVFSEAAFWLLEAFPALGRIG